MKAKHILASALLLAASAGALQAQSHSQGHPHAYQPSRQITVTGEGEMQVEPTFATITLGVTEEAEEASVAMTAVSKSMSAVIARLKDAGIAPEDMQTRQISMHPVWSNTGPRAQDGKREITGFSASNTLTVRVRDLDKLGSVLDDVLSAGANQFQGLSFGVEDPKGIQDTLRAQAVDDAYRKARQLAETTGMALGPVRDISEQQRGMPKGRMMMEMAAANSMPVEAGSLTFDHAVTIVFDISVPEKEH